MIALAESRLGAPLTEEQELAVARRQGSVLLAAGAGSGKTSVLVERYVRATTEDAVSPSEILAITFTERSAWELKERIRSRLQEVGRRDLARDVEAAAIGTFHSFCARILRSDPLAARLPPRFSILEEGLAQRTRLAAFSEALSSSIEDLGEPAVDLAAAYGVDRLRRTVLTTYDDLRSAGELDPRLPALPAGRADEPSEPEATGTLALLDGLLERFGAAYERAKRSRGVLDFDDLELRALALLREREDVRERWSERLRMLMVDELQDTNRRQLALLAAIERDNLFTVGDAWQSIYGFRSADVEIFREREATLRERGASLALTANFRSRPQVIEVVNALFQARFGEFYAPLRAARVAGGGEAPAVELLLTDRHGWELDGEIAAAVADGLPAAPIWRQAEARLLAQRVGELVAEGRARPGDVAVLLRATGDLPVYERALADEGLPTLATVGAFWDGEDVGDLLAYLRALANPLDELALYGVLRSRLAGLRLDSLAVLGEATRTGERRIPLWEALSGRDRPELERGDGERLDLFLRHFVEERLRASDASIVDLLRSAIAAHYYEERLEACGEGPAAVRQRLANVRKLLRLASSFERAEGRDLRGFLDHVSHLQESGSSSEPDAPAGDSDIDAVRLMSIHAAKGLEFPVICVGDLGRAPNRSEVPDLIVDGRRIGLRLLRLGDPEPRPALEFAALREERDVAAGEEEDRVLYVAMTRAKELLLLSGAMSFARWPEESRSRPPIGWVAPALVPDLRERLAEVVEGNGPKQGASVASELRCVLSTASRVGVALRLSRRAAEASLRAPASAPAPEVGEPPRGLEAPASAMATAAASVPSRQAAPDSARAAQPLELSSLSYTTLAELERCGYRHYLERVLRLPEASRRDARATARGARRREMLDARAAGEIAHRLLERIDFARSERPPAEQIRDVASALGFELRAAGVEQIGRLLDGLFSTPVAKRIANASEIRRELPFAFSIGEDETPISGAIDLIASERGDSRLIVDYKSGAIRAGEDLAALVEARFSGQRLIYALAALREGAEQVEVVHWFLQRPEEPIASRFDRSAGAKLERELRARVLAVRERGYAVTDDPHRELCLTCPGRTSRLCSWDEESMLRER